MPTIFCPMVPTVQWNFIIFIIISNRIATSWFRTGYHRPVEVFHLKLLLHGKQYFHSPSATNLYVVLVPHLSHLLVLESNPHVLRVCPHGYFSQLLQSCCEGCAAVITLRFSFFLIFSLLFCDGVFFSASVRCPMFAPDWMSVLRVRAFRESRRFSEGDLIVIVVHPHRYFLRPLSFPRASPLDLNRWVWRRRHRNR